MSEPTYYVRQLVDEIERPVSGRQSIVVHEDAKSKVVLFAFAAGEGLARHIAPLPATIQIIQGEALLTVGAESIAGKPGTWIQMSPKTPHSIDAETEVIMLLTLLK